MPFNQKDNQKLSPVVSVSQTTGNYNTMRIYVLTLIMLAVGLLPVQAQTSSDSDKPVVAAENYTLKPQDVIFFRVIGEPETETQAQVSNDGTISFPYLNQPVKISGLTLNQARQKLYDTYVKDIYVNPQIQINIMEYAPRYVNVLGIVGRPGPVEIPPEQTLSLLDAIGRAGGWTQLSRKRDVTLIRTMPDGQKKEFKIDARELGPNEFPLQEGDLINVPEIGL